MINLNQLEGNTSALYPFPSLDTTSNDGISMRVRAIIQDITGSHNLSRLNERITFDLNRVTKAEYIWWIDYLTDDQDLWDAYSDADQEYNRLFIEARLYLQGIGKGDSKDYITNTTKYMTLLFEIRQLRETNREIRKRLDPPAMV